MATATAQHFDTLTAAEELQAAGFEPKQAKAISQIIDRSRDSDSDAKQDLAGVKQEMIEVKQRLGEVETRLGKVEQRLGKVEQGQVRLEVGQKFLFWAIGANLTLTVGVLLKLLFN
ncbi:MAG: hypothetical protein OXU34_03215 [Gammaproteobacteria bacterium]|nr:hypothetical protein [Gammaproteobacteria bacterium]